MSFINVRYYFLIAGSLLFTCSYAQFSDSILNVSFGHATSADSSKAGPPLQIGSSGFSYTSSVCPPPGSYTVVSATTSNCFNSEWIELTHDNTPFPDSNGYMMVINDTSYFVPKAVFIDSIKELCKDVTYEFSAAIINLERPTGECVKFSSLTFQVEDFSGNIIASTSTGDIEFAKYNNGYQFTKYAVDFKIPGNIPGIVLKIFDIPKSHAITCQNALAIDDIQLNRIGSSIQISFDSTFTGDPVENLCFRNNTSLTMFGRIDSVIGNFVVQWQQSSDAGVNWANIPGATGYQLAQSFSLPDTVLYRLRGSDGCNGFSNVLKVQVNSDPSNAEVTNNSPLCSGNDLTFNANHGDFYTWSGPNGFYDTISSPLIHSAELKDSGWYYVQIKTLGGCVTRDSSYVIMIGTEAHASPDTSICKGNSVQLQASAGGITYSWSPADGLSSATINDPVATPATETVYTVRVTGADGCSDSASIRIKIRIPAAKAGISGTDYLCRPSDSASFTDISSGNIASWNWSFGNGQTAAIAQPPRQYYSINDNETSYTVMLIVADLQGCNDTAYHLIKVLSNCRIAVPNAFTPNGDGLNDYLYPLNANKATNLIFRVYNRNGQLVFATEDWTKKWDGTFQGVPQPTDVYVWMLEYNDERGKKITLKGTTVLIR